MIEGRAREAIRRDERWWDEVEMSILESDWRAAARGRGGTPGGRVGGRGGAGLGRGRRRRVTADRPGHGSPGSTRPRSSGSLSAWPATRSGSGRGRGAERSARRWTPRATPSTTPGPRRPASTAAFAAGALQRTPTLDLMLGDLDRRPRAGRRPEARRQERRGGPVHPPGDLARARQRLTVVPLALGRGPLARLGGDGPRSWLPALEPGSARA